MKQFTLTVPQCFFCEESLEERQDTKGWEDDHSGFQSQGRGLLRPISESSGGFPYGYDSWMVLLNKNPKRSESKMDDNWGTPSLGNHHIDVEYVFICYFFHSC